MASFIDQFNRKAGGIPDSAPTEPFTGETPTPIAEPLDGASAIPLPEQTTPAQPVGILSSEPARDQDAKNRQLLGKIEQQIKDAQVKANQIGADVGTITKAKEGGLEVTGQTSVEEAQAFLSGIASSPASQSLVDEVNTITKTGASDPDKLAELKQQEADANAAFAAARNAADTGDPIGLDAHVKRAEAIREKYEADLADYLRDVNKLRADRAKLSLPSAREQEIKKQLIDLRAGADAFNLQTEKDKLEEFKGQTAGFATGRASEIDFKASFARQEMALKEKNLLSELGLEQEARGFELKTIDQQISDFASDFDLRNKIEQKIQDLEQDVLDKADQLQTQAQNTLGDFIDALEGFSFEDLAPDAQKQLEQLARSAGIPFSLVQDALKASKARKTFDDSIKERTREIAEAKEERLAKAETPAEKEARKKKEKAEAIELSDEDRRNLAGSGLSVEDINNIQRDVAEHGLDVVLDAPDLTNLQKDAIKETYGQERKVTKEQVRTAAFQADPEIVAGFLRATYSDDELFKLAKEKGIASSITNETADIKRFLESRDAIELYAQLLFEQYQEAGLAE